MQIHPVGVSFVPVARSAASQPQDLLAPARPEKPVEIKRFERRTAVYTAGATLSGALLGHFAPGLVSMAPAMALGLAGVGVGLLTGMALHSRKPQSFGWKKAAGVACLIGLPLALGAVTGMQSGLGHLMGALPELARPLVGAGIWAGTTLGCRKVLTLASDYQQKKKLYESELSAHDRETETAREQQADLPASGVQESERSVALGGVVMKKKVRPPG